MTIVSGVIVLVLLCSLWIWWKDGQSFRPFRDRFRNGIRSALGVVSRDEMKVMQERLKHMEQQLGNRLTRMEGNTKFSNQLQYVSKEIERRLTQLEKSEHSTESSVLFPHSAATIHCPSRTPFYSQWCVMGTPWDQRSGGS